MEITVNLDEDVADQLERFQRKSSVALSDAVNSLLRRALAGRDVSKPFVQRTYSLGFRIPIDCIPEALELLEPNGE